MKINAVDLFCGVGGLTYGIQQAGINVVAGYDIDEKSKFAYEHNNNAKFILKDVKEIEDDEILGLYPSDTDIKVLIGCAVNLFQHIVTNIKIIKIQFKKWIY